MAVKDETVVERVAAWIERKRSLPLYGFYPEAIAREEGLPLDVVRTRLNELVAADTLYVRMWTRYCPRCDHGTDSEVQPTDEDGEVCLRCGEELDGAVAVPLFSFR